MASMISSVVNQSANMAASTAGKNVPPVRSTFGKRNIKNQVCMCYDLFESEMVESYHSLILFV